MSLQPRAKHASTGGAVYTRYTKRNLVSFMGCLVEHGSPRCNRCCRSCSSNQKAVALVTITVIDSWRARHCLMNANSLVFFSSFCSALLASCCAACKAWRGDNRGGVRCPRRPAASVRALHAAVLPLSRPLHEASTGTGIYWSIVQARRWVCLAAVFFFFFHTRVRALSLRRAGFSWFWTGACVRYPARGVVNGTLLSATHVRLPAATVRCFLGGVFDVEFLGVLHGEKAARGYTKYDTVLE